MAIKPKKSKKEEAVPEPKKKNLPKAPSAGVKARLKEKDEPLTYVPNQTERVIRKYVKRRAEEMQDFRRGLKIEERWKEADEEYVPHELDFGTTRKRFETDQDTGLRSRMVPVGDVTQQWRQNSSAPTLLSKIQTAVSIIVDQQPEANLTALLKKYAATTAIAYALWKRNWAITDAKEKLKVVVFDLIKYGWAPQRTYPRTVKYNKRVLVERDPENPENDKYIDKEITWFDDIDRQPLSPFRTWIDELSKPYDPYSTNECYYEIDYSYDQAEVEFGKYPNFKYIKRDSVVVRNDQTRKSNRATANEELKQRKDIVTIGFFESRNKDLFVIMGVKDDIVLYNSPLPNDDGYISLTHTLWMLRKSTMPYGVSLWEVIRQNKSLYDKMKNMTMDQLVLSIMKFGFFSGTNTALGDGKIEIVPGQARQLTSSTGKPEINWMEIPGPGAEAWKGLEAVSAMMDDESGISPTLEGQVTGKTLGEILHAKEASLKRLKTPVENIAWLIDQDAYLTLSWMSQVYTIPTVVKFSDERELMAFEKENQVNRFQLFGTPNPTDEGQVGAPYEAHYLPQLALHLEDRDGQMMESKESKFYQIGKDIQPEQLKWKGIFKTIPRSIVDSSQELVKATKMEMFNVLVPLFKFPPELVANSAAQICKVNEEDPKDWLPTSWIQYLAQGEGAAVMPAAQPGAPVAAPGQPQQPPAAPGAPQQAPPGIFVPGGGAPAQAPGGMPPGGQGPTMQSQAGMTPGQAPTVVPRGDISGAPDMQGGAGLFKRRL